MTIDEMLAGEWKVLIGEAPADLARTITFADGTVVMHNATVGNYAAGGDKLKVVVGSQATIDLTLPDMSPVITGLDVPATNVLQGNMMTDLEGDDPMIEPVVLTRVISDVVEDEELRRRVANG